MMWSTLVAPGPRQIPHMPLSLMITLRLVFAHPLGIFLPEGRLPLTSRLPTNAPYLNSGVGSPYLRCHNLSHLRVVPVASASKTIKHSANQLIQIRTLGISVS